MPITADKRGFVAGKYGVELDGIMAGWVFSAEGGHATSDVISEKMGPDHVIKKHIGGVKYEQIEFNAGTGLNKSFYEWIKSTFDGKYVTSDGSIRTADSNYSLISTLDFHRALISEVGFPELDAASKDAGKMTVKLMPEYATFTVGGGGKVNTSVKASLTKWMASNFRLQIAGLDCTKVSKIEALTARLTASQNLIGADRLLEIQPISFEIPDLRVTQPRQDRVRGGRLALRHRILLQFASQLLSSASGCPRWASGISKRPVPQPRSSSRPGRSKYCSAKR